MSYLYAEKPMSLVQREPRDKEDPEAGGSSRLSMDSPIHGVFRLANLTISACQTGEHADATGADPLNLFSCESMG